MEAAGLVVGVISLASLWEACMQVFDVVVTAQRYSWDCEVARVKLGIERARLALWGQTVGFTDSRRGGTMTLTSTHDARVISQPAPRQHPRLKNPQVANVIRDSLGCLHHLFEKIETLQRRYALHHDTGRSSSASTHDLSARTWSSILGRRSDLPRDSPRACQSKENVTTRTRWAVSDKKRFEELIGEIRWFNDSLCQLVFDEPGSRNDRLFNIDEDEEVGSQEEPMDDLSSVDENVSMLEDWVFISPDELPRTEYCPYTHASGHENIVRPHFISGR
ncbi:prion-inhibition and propagation, helo domain-containing protein [Schizophyllum commune]